MLRYLLGLGAIGLAVYWIVSQPPRVGFATAVAGVPVNRTVPAITGDQRLGGTLTCSRGTWDEPGSGANYGFAYQWIRDNVDLTGRTDAEYTVTTADIGRSLRCAVRATGSQGATTTSSAALTPPAPRTLTPPRLSGDLRLGQTLRCSRGTWDDQGVADYVTSFAWLRDGQAIAGQTGSTYTLTRPDIGRSISCRVSVDVLASSTSNGVVPTPPAIHSLPAITGDPRLGGTLSCTRGAWDDEDLAAYTVTRQWLRNGAELLGATGEQYVVKLTDVNQSIACRVRAEALTDATSATVSPTPPSERSQPGIEGDPRLGRTLTCTRGAWDDSGREGDYNVTYEWYRAGVFVSNGAQFPVNAIDVNKVLRCQVVVEGSTTSASPNLTVPAPLSLAAPTISGDARLGRTVGCDKGTWDDQGVDPYSVTYQWLRSNVVIDGATAQTYTLTADDVTRSITCRVTASGFTNATSAGISIPAPENQLAPHIEGDPRIDQTLTCTRGDWDDPAGAPYPVTYQWYRGSNTVITGATEATYKPVAGDTNIHCRVRAANQTTVSSPAINGAATQATGGKPVSLIAPSISGDRRLRRTVTCHRGSWNDAADTRYPVTYRWRRNAVAIDGATAAQYTIAAADMGQTLTCEVTADNGVAGSTSAVTPGMIPATPRAVVLPGVSGAPRLRGTLSCTRGGWYDEPTERYAVTYRWLRGSTAISGATDATYTVTAADIGQNLSCEVRAEGLTTSQSPAVGGSAPRAVLGPVLTGNPRLRKTVGCSRGTWDDVAGDRYAVAYAWQRGSTTITGQTDPTYTVTAADTGSSISCTLRAESLTNAGPFNGAETVRAPQNRVLPRLSGHPRVRQTLSCTRGDWDDDAEDRYAVSYRWLRGSTVIPDATSAAYVTTAQDAGQSVACRVRAEDATDATSAALAIRRPVNTLLPTISGEPRLNRTLACTRGDWDDTVADRYAVTYTWLRSNVVIPSANTSALTLTREDVGKAIACRVRAEDQTDATSATVTTQAPQALLRPMLSGQPHLRGELACTRGTWDDTPEQRYSVSYQWYRSSAPINGATNPTYVVGTADLGRSLSCSATAEILTESFAAAVTVATPVETVLPRIEGIAHPRRELTCGRGEWNDSPGKRYVTSFKWRRNGVNIPDADGPDHIVTAADVGSSLTCAVTAEGSRTAVSAAVTPTWEPLRLTLMPDADASPPAAFNAYTARLRNENPVPVPITQFDLTLPGGFSFRPGTTTGALAVDPVPTGPGSLILRWTQDFVVPAQGEAVLRIGITTAAALGDGLASARAYPTSSAFTIPLADRVARITVEGAEPAAGACTVIGTDGPDVLVGTPGGDVICGFGDDDVIRGMGGDDELWGGPGDDRIEGGDGADVLRGGDGADVLDGGLGADVLRGGGGLDSVLYTSRTNPVLVTVGVTNEDDGEAGEGDTVGSDTEIVRGGQGDDTLTGGLGPEELYGRGGNDTLDGGPGSSDLLDGGDGADTLIGRDGLIDRLVCGGDVDRYDADILDRVVGCENPFVSGGLL